MLLKTLLAGNSEGPTSAFLLAGVTAPFDCVALPYDIPELFVEPFLDQVTCSASPRASAGCYESCAFAAASVLYPLGTVPLSFGEPADVASRDHVLGVGVGLPTTLPFFAAATYTAAAGATRKSDTTP